MDNEILSEEPEETTPDNITEEASALEELSEPEELSEEIPETNGFKRFLKAERGKSKEETTMFFAREILSWVIIVFSAFFLAIVINMYILRVSNVVGKSMCNTYQGGERVVLSKLPYIFGEPQRGDIIIFDSSLEEKNFFEGFAESCSSNMLTQMFMDEEKKSEVIARYYIKRIVAVEGDTISIKDNQVYLNGELLDETYLSDDITADYRLYEGMSWTVGKDEVFVMGDNRAYLMSRDSRDIGCVPVGCILGKVIID
ncbi:MAG: signal peptidase I [Clostridia bacterium]|nr:signal peptidase I [Clostridia bacterium]